MAGSLAKPTVRELAYRAAQATKTCPKDVLGRSRYAMHVVPRWAAMLAAHRGGASYAHIGRQFGRDHTTVMHAVRCGAQRAETDPEFGRMVESLSTHHNALDDAVAQAVAVSAALRQGIKL